MARPQIIPAEALQAINHIRRIGPRRIDIEHKQVCRYLVKDFGTSQSPKSTRQRDSRYCPD
ncbi:MAG: hypothetical protein G8D59_11340, partial [gamma proteobacterium symbiont of Phacoides pectinatus]